MLLNLTQAFFAWDNFFQYFDLIVNIKWLDFLLDGLILMYFFFSYIYSYLPAVILLID